MLSGADVAAAQLCVGNTAFSLASLHTAANVGIDKLAQLYTLEARFRYHHAFVGAEYGLKTWELTSLDGNSRAVALNVGLEATAAHSKFAVCPLLRWTWFSGPHEIAGSYWNFSEHTYSAGLSVGYLLARTKIWDFMPTAALTIGTGDPKLTTVFGGSLQDYQDFCCGWQSFTTLRLGLGLGYSDQVTLIPSVSLPLGDGAQKTLGIRALFRLGKGI
jgi:hypothetical protein